MASDEGKQPTEYDYTSDECPEEDFDVEEDRELLEGGGGDDDDDDGDDDDDDDDGDDADDENEDEDEDDEPPPQKRSSIRPLSETSIRIETKVYSNKKLPDLHQLMVEAADILNIEAPDLYIRQNPVPNAYTLAVTGKKPFVVVHTSLVELLTRKELQAVLAHELGHLKCDHGVWLTFANILTLGAYTVPGVGGFIAQSLEEQLFRWLRAAELTCDRAALLVAQDPKKCGASDFRKTLCCTFAGIQKAKAYLRNAQTRQLSHPLPVLRAREIDEWSRSQEYQSLLRRATQLSSVQKP
ncbi:hypothetical protein GIB67_009338 [Kingdonia uniflora]|uniref:Peptidase M48 domain-containing protein n=1 Tax=Kingdonia uniflora TaxID=39325 RepID=A0A7J7N2N1_9MAGN|nr:hypothetical protein GIB67_009338 [Kingdonia uniflora]